MHYYLFNYAQKINLLLLIERLLLTITINRNEFLIKKSISYEKILYTIYLQPLTIGIHRKGFMTSDHKFQPNCSLLRES